MIGPPQVVRLRRKVPAPWAPRQHPSLPPWRRQRYSTTGRHYGTLDETYHRELIRLAAVGVADPEVTSTGGNCYALTGDAGYAPNDRSIYLLATPNGDPALTT